MLGIRTSKILFVAIFLICCSDANTNEHENKHPNYILTAKQVGFGVDEYLDKQIITEFGIELELIGKYDTLPPIYFMNCSWGDQTGKVDNDDYYIGYHSCDANFQSFGRVTTTKSLQLKTVIVKQGHIDEFDERDIRIGFAVIDTLVLPFRNWFNMNMTDDWDKAIDSLSNDISRVVWSNSITLKELEAKVEDIGYARLTSKKSDSLEH